MAFVNMQSSGRRRISCMYALLLALVTLLSLPHAARAVTQSFRLTFAPQSGTYTLSDTPAVFSWSGTASDAPSPAPAGSLRVNVLPSVLGGAGISLAPGSATPSVVAAAQSAFANLPSALQDAVNEGTANYTGTQDQVSVVSMQSGTASLWALKEHASRPAVSFASARMLCDPIVLNTRTHTFSCASTSALGYAFVANFSSSVLAGSVDDSVSDTRVIINVVLESDSVSAPLSTDALWSDLLAVAYTKVRSVGVSHLTYMSMRSSDVTRRHGARVAVAFIWIFILFTALFAVCVAATWIAWATPFVGNRCMRIEAIAVVVGCLALLFLIVGLTEGLAGFLVVLMLMLFTTAIISLMYCCLRARSRDRDRGVHPVGDSLAGAHRPAERMQTQHHVAYGSSLDQPMEDETPQQMMDSAASNLLEAEQAASSLYKVPSVHRNGTTMIDDRTPLKGTPASPSDGTSVHSLFTLRDAFTRYPDSLGSRQRTILGWCAMSFLVGAVICVAIFGLWSVDEYRVWDRNNSAPVVELMPQAISKATFLIYAFDGFANRIKMNSVLFDVSTQWCGRYYNTELTTPAQRYSSIYRAFVLKYSIDMNQYVPSAYDAYPTVNAWFARSLKPGTRVVAAPMDDTVIVSPADARLLAFAVVPQDSFVWIKDTSYTVQTLIGSVAYNMASTGNSFADGSMALVRLAPQDYHRFHTPVSGRIISSYVIEGGFHSVNADAMTSGNYAIYNQRHVVVIDTAGYANIGRVAYVAIGALCVGSITFVPQVNDLVTKGDSIGYFMFGGSTVAVIFEHGRVTFDADILERSLERVETLVQVNTHLAVKAT